MELYIDGEKYTFEYNFGFVRKINRKVTTNVGDNNAKQNQGLAYAIAQIMDGDIETLADVLDTANEGQQPRLTMAKIEEFFDDPETDIDDIFETVLDFFEKSNCTKKTYARVKEMQEALKKANS